ncbi:MAG TPA: hypothetical protein VFP71_12070 [Candidatus Angelobacter sp.]|nr:hypothetical protein [Candidatus Angelobacter sp.]
MDELLAAIKNIDDEEEDILINFQSIILDEGSLKTRLALGLAGDPPQRWDVHCGHVLSYNLQYGFANFFDLSDEHPVLWEFKHMNASAFFLGIPTDIPAALHALQQAHEKLCSSWIPFSRYFHVPLPDLLAAGHGLLARGPIELLEQYRSTLSQFGTSVSICSSYMPRNDAEEIKVLFIGSSYIVGSQWGAHKIKD